MFNLKINEKHEKQKKEIDYSTFVAAMSVSLFTGCSNDATITGLDEGALPELASDTRAVTDELIESDSISNFSLLAATEYSDAELKKRIRDGWWKQYAYTLPDGKVTQKYQNILIIRRIYIRMLLHYFMLEVRYWKMLMYNSLK